MPSSEIIVGDCREVLAGMAERSVQCVVTSPPYWGLRDYGVDGQLGSEPTPEEYLATMVDVFRGVRRVLRDDGTLWLNMGDSYNNSQPGARDADRWPKQARNDHRIPKTMCSVLKPKDLCGMPWRLALALQADGWWLRSDIIWAKPNPMPESCTDRPTKSHEYVFLLTKRPTYYWDAEAVREKAEYGYREHTGEMRSVAQDGRRHTTGTTKGGDSSAGRNIRTVWNIPTQSFPDAHFATFPEKLVEPCVRAGTSAKGCCPECGAGWVRVVERDRVATRPGKDSKVYVDPEGSPYEEHAGSIVGNRDPKRHVTETITTGWRPGCECTNPQAIQYEMHNGETGSVGVGWNPVPCVCLDPFAGSGTVGVVCARENRAFIGIELNPEYAKMAEERIRPVMGVADDDRRQATFAYEESPE